MRKLILILPFIFLPSIAHAGDQPNTQGCYQTNWFYPWLDLPSTNCTHPAFGDPDHTTPTIHHNPKPPREPPPHECPYDNKA